MCHSRYSGLGRYGLCWVPNSPGSVVEGEFCIAGWPVCIAGLGPNYILDVDRTRPGRQPLVHHLAFTERRIWRASFAAIDRQLTSLTRSSFKVYCYSRTSHRFLCDIMYRNISRSELEPQNPTVSTSGGCDRYALALLPCYAPQCDEPCVERVGRVDWQWKTDPSHTLPAATVGASQTRVLRRCGRGVVMPPGCEFPCLLP
jgi:hypothetical protein